MAVMEQDFSGTALSPTREEALRRLTRVSDRLRVVGPRLAAREGEAAAEQLGRIRTLLQDLADLAADTDGHPRRTVPELAAHALADQLLVLGHEVLGSPDPATPDPRSDLFRRRAVAVLDQLSALL